MYLKEGASVQDHINTMIEIFNELASVGVDITDEDQIIFLFSVYIFIF